MKMSWKVARLFGIDVYIHFTFLLIPCMVLFVAISNGAGLVSLLKMVALVTALFLCVVLHEYGHALTARWFGIGTRDITLLPIGGLARLERMPRKPLHEFWISIAGPLVNVAIAAMLGVLLLGTEGLSSLALFPSGGQSLLSMLVSMNLLLVAFNLLPAFPMDGGRVLRSALAGFLDFEKATFIAVRVGQVLAFGLGIFGLLTGQLTLPFIAAFVFFGAAAELAQVRWSVARSRMAEQWGSRWAPGQPPSGAGSQYSNPPGRASSFDSDSRTIDATAQRVDLNSSDPVDEDGKPPRQDPSGLYRKVFVQREQKPAQQEGPSQTEAEPNGAGQEVETIYFPNGSFINIIRRA